MSDQALVKTKATVIIKVITRTNKKEDHVMEAYLKKIDIERYRSLIERLGIRK